MPPASTSLETLAAALGVGSEGQRRKENRYLPAIKLATQTNKKIRL